MEVRVFEHALEEHDELSHRGGHRHHGLFSGGAQARVELAQDAVVPHGAQCGHGEGAAHGGASSPDAAHALAGAAVTVAGGQAGERGGLAFIEGAQPGHPGLQDGGDDGADAGDLLHALGARLHLPVCGELCGDGRIALFDLPVEQGQQRAALPAQQFAGVVRGAVALGGARPEELRAASAAQSSRRMRACPRASLGRFPEAPHRLSWSVSLAMSMPAYRVGMLF